MFLRKSEGADKLSHSFESCKDGVLSTERIFPKKDFEGGLILMFAIEEIRVGTGELVEVVEEEIDLVFKVFSHGCVFIIMGYD